ncbi:MAG: MarR family transcriptional regulator, partial [Gammaproteobacteria bacterium]|nr:MarR family transcriptional regulator [Gemmatimonadota bacterium]NIR38251.1 MarR family transcriptional regulator [Actinomycetota bacterium]NIU76218.1 MarR family transcriptional regulator [Gammaproteobacteria bacterium]NIX22064.1 MarR family transcriptional regulator [Actinomycetota bacterium]
LSVLVYGGPKTVGELASAEQVTAPTMSRLVTALEREGHVRRRPDAADGRRVRVEVTRSGREAL